MARRAEREEKPPALLLLCSHTGREDLWNNTRLPQTFIKEVICWSGGVIHRAHYGFQSQVLADSFVLSIFLTLVYDFPSFSLPSLCLSQPPSYTCTHTYVIKEPLLSSCVMRAVLFLFPFTPVVVTALREGRETIYVPVLSMCVCPVAP